MDSLSDVLIGNRDYELTRIIIPRISKMDRIVERRKYKRLKVQLPAEFILEGNFKNAVIKDIGGGGIRLQTNNAILNSPIFFQFCLEVGKSTIIAKGNVVWSKCFGDYYEAGLQFISIAKDDKYKIIDYVKNKLKTIDRIYSKPYTYFPDLPPSE